MVDAPGMIALSEQGRAAPLVRIVRDIEVAGAEKIKFSRDGNSLVSGHPGRTVTACDLNEVQRRLAEVAFGCS